MQVKKLRTEMLMQKTGRSYVYVKKGKRKQHKVWAFSEKIHNRVVSK